MCLKVIKLFQTPRKYRRHENANLRRLKIMHREKQGTNYFIPHTFQSRKKIFKHKYLVRYINGRNQAEESSSKFTQFTREEIPWIKKQLPT
jgi:hypothetical protein